MMRVTAIAILVIAATGLLPTGPVAAASLQEHESIRAAVRSFLASRATNEAEQVEIKVNRLDPRLRLQACGDALEAFLPPGAKPQGHTSVGVRCPGPKPWKLYVPAEVVTYGQVVVAARPLPRGQILRREDLQLARRELAQPHGYYRQTQRLVGKQVRRRLSPGEVLNPATVKSRRLVRRGDRVTLVAGGDSVQVQMRGEALSDGSSGDRVRVRNARSERVVEGVVVGRGRIRIGAKM